MGNEVSSQQPSGLHTTTTYDQEYHSLPIRVLHKGDGVLHTQLSAYDKLSELPVAHRNTKGLLTCISDDAFGRAAESKVNSAEPSDFQQPALEFLGTIPAILDPQLPKELATSFLDPDRHVTYEKMTTKSDSNYLCTVSVVESSNGLGGCTKIVEAVNCVNKTYRQSTKHGKNIETWKYWKYDLQGLQLLESFPIHLPPALDVGIELDFTPDPETCNRVSYNCISQPIEIISPGRGGKYAAYSVVTRLEYLNGGATTSEKKYRREGQAEILLSSTSRTSMSIREKEYVTEVIDENGLKSTYTYDAAGRLNACQDHGGKTETRTYNTHGQIATLNNSHQNMLTKSDAVAIRREYDVSGRLLAETNALGERVEYESGSKMRPLRKTGHNGQQTVFKYDENGFESLSSVTTYASTSTERFETRIEYQYDARGRASVKTVSFADVSSYTTSIAYDWQDKVSKVILPDGAIVSSSWEGVLASSIGIVGPIDHHWNIEANLSTYNAFDRPEKCQVTGSSFTRPYLHEHNYDNRGFTLSHSLTGSAPLVQNLYVYGDLDQLYHVEDLGSGETTAYTYSGKRLTSSRSKNGSTTYNYDTSGNIISRGSITLSYDSSSVCGTEDGSTSFNVDYDGAGRMTSRRTNESNIGFKYDDFGNLASITDARTKETTNIILDGQGNMIKRIQADGSQEIFVNKSYSVIVKADGQRSTRYALFNDQDLIATMVTNQPSSSGSRDPHTQALIHYLDTKNNITHTFNASDESLHTRLCYDDYGLLQPSKQGTDTKDDLENTYESRYLDEKSGLLYFGARWYDPLVCRFITPDNITDPMLLLATDGMNRHAFENNDPINHIDPTGHWSWNATWGVLAGAGLIAAGALLTMATGGAAAPLWAIIISGALTGGGIGGVFYSLDHSNEKVASKFWAGWGMTFAINAAVGAATAGITWGVGALSGYSASLQRLSTSTRWAYDSYKYKASNVAARMLGSALLGGSSSVLTKAGARWVGNKVYGRNEDIWKGAERDFAQGFIQGLVLGGAEELIGKYGDRADESLSGTWNIKVTNLSFSDVYKRGIASNDKFINSVSVSNWRPPSGSDGLFMPSGKVVWF
ncbi:virulence plasmid b [Fusarium beomiforme]|uniref:Virulence plasmid b n=1 Tax=Fusarium beomiforme TaxID=44412 RepID=A0A9P5AAT9_9HYPO|nr:virulence plasmid b [Fusarium beomiforme]